MNRNACGLVAALCLAPNLAHAAPPDSLLQSLAHCAAIAQGPARLACYDQLAPQFRPPAPPTRAEKESWFGLDNLFGGGEDKPQATPQAFGEERIPKTPEQQAAIEKESVESITAKLSDYAKNASGKFIVFLANGQVWSQLSSDSGKASFAKIPKDNTVTIERAFLGSYSMTISNNTKLFKVKRLK
ncbi:MAG TPA: hypothetical protein VL026_07255 [Rhizomicrobium sp.]|nr:hypothetical protein [Rhizomicrobium sp.]